MDENTRPDEEDEIQMLIAEFRRLRTLKLRVALRVLNSCEVPANFQPITQKDVDAAVEANREKKAKEEADL